MTSERERRRRSRSRGRSSHGLEFPLRKVAAGFLGVALAALLLRNFATTHESINRQTEDLQAVALIIQSGQSGDPSDAPAIGQRASARLLREPLAVPAISTLALADQVGPDSSAAAPARSLLFRRTKRDVPTLIWDANRSLDAHDTSSAVADLDALLRLSTDRPLMDNALQTIVRLIGDPIGFQAVVAALDAEPKWREGFLSSLAASGPIDAFPRVIAAINPLASGDPETSWRPYLARLVASGDIGHAYALWVGQQSPDRLALLGNLFNGGFDGERDGTAFDWSLGRGPGISIDYAVPAVPDKGPALSLEFSGTSVRSALASQALVLPAGSFRLHGDIRMDDLETTRGVSWRIVCIEGTATKLIAETDRFSGSRDWSAFSVPFEVPSDHCGSQILQLLVPARISAEQPIRGHVWFDNMAIDRETGISRVTTGP